MLLIRYLLAFFVASLLSLPTPSFAHLTEEITHCPIFNDLQPTQTPRLLKIDAWILGLVSETYDVTGDGRPDIVVHSPSLGGVDKKGLPNHKIEANFYEVDEDGDQAADVIYIDIMGTGRCEDLLLYKHIVDENIYRGGLASWTK